MSYGNIFEGGMDLTALPCSSKKTITSSAATWVKLFGLTAPEDIRERLELGQIIRPRRFTGDSSFTKHYTWAASVFNDRSTSEALERIGKALGQCTVREIKGDRLLFLVEIVLGAVIKPAHAENPAWGN